MADIIAFLQEIVPQEQSLAFYNKKWYILLRDIHLMILISWGDSQL